MIRYQTGNLLDAPAEALVNTVNEVGVMGKGIALMFRDAYPESSRIYLEASKSGKVRVGRVLTTHNPSFLGPQWIIHFPTKKDWRQPSRIEWIRKGLKDLADTVRREKIRSIALPPLGCGNGGLDWLTVKTEIENAFKSLTDVDVIVYEPTEAYMAAPKPRGLEKLTPARALIAELVRRYAILGLECTQLEVQKLAWFLDRFIKKYQLPDPLNLHFRANRYGPYADRLRHLLDSLDGSYLHSEKRLADAGPFDIIWFEDSKRKSVMNYLAGTESERFLPALERTSELIEGFESPLGMELLATVDWLLVEGCAEPSIESLRIGVRKWPGGPAAARRKAALFDDRMLDLALNRLISIA